MLLALELKKEDTHEFHIQVLLQGCNTDALKALTIPYTSRQFAQLFDTLLQSAGSRLTRGGLLLQSRNERALIRAYP